MATLVYKYGMRLRGYSIGAQPAKGLIDHDDDPMQEYWSLLWYDRPLTDQEMKHYDIDYIRTERRP